MTVELNADLIVDYLWQRELYLGAHMIKRDKDAESGMEPSTYLGMQVTAPADRGQRPQVPGAAMVVLPAPAWCHDPCGDEPPLGYSIDEVGAALGGASVSTERVE